MLNIKKIVVGELETNCYIIENKDECLVIDPGDEFLKIKNSINKKVVGVLLTHRHFDHVGALKEIVDYFGVLVFARNNLSEGKCSIGSFNFIVNYNFGHTMDSISYIFEDIMFSGDFIFKGCIGRTDLGGDFAMMQDSIGKILKSENDYKIYPGHGDVTTLDEEREMLKYYLK